MFEDKLRQGRGMMVQQFADSEAADRMLSAFAQMEHQQLRAACDLAAVAGVDYPDALPNVEERREMLKSLLVATVSGEFEAWWVEHIGSEHFTSDPPAEHVGVGTDSDTWHDQLTAWSDGVRAQVGDVDGTDRELAALACREVYGVDLDEYEARVVNMDPGATVNRMVSGNFQAAQNLMREVEESIRDDPSEPEE